MNVAFARIGRLIRVVLMVPAALLYTLAAHSDPPAAGGPLDGMVFSGRIGPVDNPDLTDHLYFENGRFWSGQCVHCGFEPGVYWIRRTGEGIAFRGVLQSAERGTFTYSGLVKGDSVEVSIHWRQERWYWTIDRELRFVGRRVAAETAGMTLEEANALVSREGPRPNRCPS